MLRARNVKAVGAFFVLVLSTANCVQTCNHHECDLDSFAAHCDGDVLVSCEDRSEGDPCVVNEGCDTYVTETTCRVGCVAAGRQGASCAADPDDDAAAPQIDAGSTRDAQAHADAGSDEDATDDATVDAGS